ncbi:hypothetical protein DFO70_13518 [Cytobacillus firmus]|uniref:Uridine kinase n=2 Tax=Cytobacillus TaxID=2675230 RepID=A0A366JG79_CYTFI|nr:hypothetical protein DFO70_13518 [Cytobacillus firmus]TDX35528.1 hypothetical protein DFO72_12624 [Cytobacillus oceanisediminis]
MIIGISGHGAAGKTTFAHNLMEELKYGVNYLNTVHSEFINSKVHSN